MNKKPGARSIEDINVIRAKAGLRLKKKAVIKRKSFNNPVPILKNSKKARHQEILAGMLNVSGKKVVDKVLNKALNDNDDDQMACLKIVMDRILPSDYINKMKGNGNQIQISISGIDKPEIRDLDEVKPIDMETIEDGK